MINTNKIKWLMVLVALLFGAMSTISASNSFFAKYTDLTSGNINGLEFVLTNNTSFYGLQAEIKLPEGLEFVTENGKPDISLSNRAAGFSIVSNLISNSSIRVALFSVSHNAISGTDGVLLTVKVKAADNFTGGNVTVSNIILTNEDDNDVNIEDSSSSIGYIKLVTGITLNETSLGLTEGETATLTATVTPADATDKTITWTSSDASVASVSAEGEVTAVKAGTATITATSSNSKTATCTVTVAAKVIEATGVTLNNTELGLTEGETATLTATVAPADATDKSITWSSSDESIATVTATGEITAVKAGTATITASSSNGKTANCTVTVAAKVIEATGVTLNKTELGLTEGETATLTATVTPADATDKSISWSSSNEAVAAVTATGEVTAVKAGTATITATSSNGKTATCTVTVAENIISVTGISISKSELSMTEGDKETLTVEVLPADATDKSITWASSDESIATVSATGEVTAVKAGTATITATSSNSKTATCTVTVAAKVIEATGVTLNKTELSLTEGETATLTAAVLPENATDKTITWTSSDKSIATVSATGEVTAVKAGTVTITASSSNGKTATCTVTVAAKVIKVTGVALNKPAVELKVGETEPLTATVAPDNATDKSISWSSSDESVATVDANGKITAKAIGETTITATCGTVTATCRVTVIPTPVESITLSKTSLSLTEGEAATLTATVVPSDATDKSITWTSSDENIATVSATGEITAVKAGFATITASSSNGKTATCAVTVAANIIPVIRISISKSELSMTEGEKETLVATVLPENATDKTIAWTSNNESVATVSATGEVTAVKAGFATITASTSNGKAATCTVTVAAKIFEATGITLSKTAVELEVGETETLTATVAPDNTTDKTITWTSSKESIATVDANGKITAKAIGETTITATCGTATATCTVTVIPTPVESITLSNSTLSLTEGERTTLTATIAPSDATDKSITWTSSDENIATVSVTGEVTAVKVGTATIMASSSNGKTATCSVTVVAKIISATGITLSKSAVELKVGDTETLTATVAPDNTTDKTITWISSDESVATIDVNGKITAKAIGETTIIVTCGTATATCMVTVIPTPVESIILSNSTLSLTEGEKANLTATVAPSDATDKTIAWTSSDENIATVSATGEVTAIKAGTATITASSSNGNTAICTVTVAKKVIEVSGITLSKTELSLTEGETSTLTATVVPSDATDKKITWTSSDQSIATVSATGEVTAVKAGTATITASSSNGKTATCIVTVVAKQPEVPEVIIAESLTITPYIWSIHEGSTFTIKATVLPENTSDKSLNFESSDPTVASVDEAGNVKLFKDGYCKIIVSTLDGSNLTAECVITSQSGMESIFVDPETEVDVYDMNGILLKRKCSRNELKTLKPAVYILRSGNTIVKAALK